MILSIIIVSFNTKELLKRCLESIFRVEEWKSGRVEIIVIDNASTDGSKEYLKTQNLKLIFNNQNLGFAKANNQGIKEAQGEHVLLLNSDTEVKPEALGKLIKFAQDHSEAGIIGARLLNPDGSIQPSVYHLPTLWRAIREYWFGQKCAYEKYIPVGERLVEVEAVVGAAMLIPKKVIKQIGLLDERYFLYFEDLNYCRRVRRAGLKVYYLPSSEIVHSHGASGKKISGETSQWLRESSKIYHGKLKYYLLTFIIWLGQKWQKILKF